MTERDLRVYAVTDRAWLKGRTLREQVEEALRGGVTFVQLREKRLDHDAFLKEAIEIGDLCRQYHVPFVINDALDIALESGADGVHVGQGDLPAHEVRALLGPERIIGVSCHTVEQALEAQEQGADYLGVGAVFPTGTKTDAAALPPETLREICRAVSVPVVAIGGISLQNVDLLAGSGIAGIAVVSAIFAQPDITAATRALRKKTDDLFGEQI